MLAFASYSFGDALLTVLELALFVAWLCLLFYIYGDIFRSHDLSGAAKTLWVVAIFILPMLGTLAYLLVRGGDMHERAALAAQRNAGSLGSVGQLERLAALHRDGVLSDEEFESAKRRLLS